MAPVCVYVDQKTFKDRTIYIRFQCIVRPSTCIRVVLLGEALHVNLTVLLLLLKTRGIPIF